MQCANCKYNNIIVFHLQVLYNLFHFQQLGQLNVWLEGLHNMSNNGFHCQKEAHIVSSHNLQVNIFLWEFLVCPWNTALQMTKINIIYFNLTRLLDPKKTITGNMISKIYMYLGLVRPQKNQQLVHWTSLPKREERQAF